ncbi:MAG: fluoride efflux transporter CrcB [Rhodospirillaceae bacterium]|jgi:CrcB protein|nr:fluoride efflux transporter CrcB [Rhodospirillaceae bacterium]MBT4046440.1 fluoride efflux transporter CrcB [Rhodospirillaceae bacterium]MBT4687009.1 fluoride efflux transporter CrcB [Rhodospirillaceae bacterium]MBT5080374.1 fluoride efflux transporter CrcB [Rhodospirillaceae bacterium]MBT5522732.1 fluoride efflux transporter CrcB [Rhodospirillaceae bacterium]
MNMLLAVACGGALGAMGRHLVSGQVMRWAGSGFPWGTLTVNVLGSFVLGVLVEYLALRWSTTQEMRGFLVVGMLGGFTTFSAFSLDAVLLLERGQLGAAFAYISGNLLLSICGLFAGLLLFREILT